MVEYKYDIPIDSEKNCLPWDIHWLRPKIYYETGLFPDWITLCAPNAVIGFNVELTKDQKALLDSAMTKADLGSESFTASQVKLTANIHPINLQEACIKAINKKPLYYCAEGLVLNLIFFEKLTEEEIKKVKIALSEMWA